MRADFRKYQALGNDYIVIDPSEFPFEPLPEAVKAVCDRSFGVGSDGILLGPLSGPMDSKGSGGIRRLGGDEVPWLRIFNPDGSEAEKSGNGLRIFSLYLAEAGYVGNEEFKVGTRGGTVLSRVESLDPVRIRVDMGRPSFSTAAADLACPGPEFVLGRLDLGSEVVEATFVSMGNPHCVIFVDEPSPELARRLGPLVERHPFFPQRTNVQFAKVLDPHRMRIQIWERGAGYTLASGSSSCAAASAAKRLGFVSGKVQVDMEGGTLDLDLSGPGVLMTGPALKVYDGVFSRATLLALADRGAIGRV
jgi:diaminopimelate epimerase